MFASVRGATLHYRPAYVGGCRWLEVPRASAFRAWSRTVPIYTIKQICEPGEVAHKRRINCQTDSEALAVAQRMADAGFMLQLWRGDELVVAVVAAHVRQLRC